MNHRTLLSIVVLAAAVAGTPAVAQERSAVLADVLDIDATVSSEVAPDLAVVTMAIVREGTDVSALTKDVNETLARAFVDAKSVPGVISSNGSYSTFPRFDTKGGQSTRTGWQVRAEMVLRSKDFSALGNLVGRLSQTMQIAGSGFEISPDLRAKEGSALIDRGAKAFQDKALAATRAFGYSGYSIRQVTVGSPGQSGNARTYLAEASFSKSAAPLPVEAGLVTLSLTVNGSLQLRK